METTDRATEFVVFCIENTAMRLGISGDILYKEMKRLNAIEEFLYPSYPTLHTQSKDYIVDEVLTYLKQKTPKFIESVDFWKGENNMVKNPLINETLLQMKFARVVSLLAKTLQISQVRALDLFYTSEVYRCLSNLEYHLHNRSDAYIVDELILELQAKM
ncbi:Protein of unknown function [Prevotella sp. khp1]|uniref:DUF3791 domain-containing protein n=1 Tax=Prevotellaceae TaxID=171552 RepID=UPI00088EE189|nr:MULTISPECIES: DUF3791 domain-containing protein [Prevotellaceae]QVJ81871.1 DUF3791 domain-containing protein [Xylanibacter ruminicola]SDQ76531.1 Protein of unknown function [Prevotella sp. khp1]